MMVIFIKEGLFTRMISNDSATIISGVLSMFGGAIGAFGAYMVAKHQMKSERNDNRINRLLKELPIYIAMRIEFKKMNDQLVALNEAIGNYGGEVGRIEIDRILWERWEMMNKVSDLILLEEFYIFHEAVQRTLEVFAYDFDLAASKLINANNQSDIEKLKIEYSYMSQEKQNYLQELPYMQEKTELFLKAVDAKINSINQLVNGEIDIKDYKQNTDRKLLRVNR